jgi:hypothetical protein
MVSGPPADQPTCLQKSSWTFISVPQRRVLTMPRYRVFLPSVVILARDPGSEVACVTPDLDQTMRNEREPLPFCASSRPTSCSVSTRGGRKSLLFPYGNQWATFSPAPSAVVGQSHYCLIHSGLRIAGLSHRAEASCGIVAAWSDTPVANAVESGGFRRPARARLANSAQELTRGQFVGPPAEPARESSEHHGVTAVADRGYASTRVIRGNRRAA